MTAEDAVSFKAKNRRLLCVLFLRLSPLSAGPGQTVTTPERG
jgi:hypothetical protein